MHLLHLGAGALGDLVRFGLLLLSRDANVRAENLFLRKQLTTFVERGVKPRRTNDREKLTLVLLAKLFDWRDALVIVSPRTFKSWQKAIERSYWRWISRPRAGRPPLPLPMRELIRRIARENPQWSCGEIARVVEVQLGARVDAKTVRRYLPLSDPRRRRGRRRDQTWSAFVRNHAKQIAACDFVSVMTVRFRILYVFVVMEIGSRKILHVNVTEHPTAAWCAQQLRDAFHCGGEPKYLIHDGAGMFNDEFRGAAQTLGVEALRTPPHAPKANAFCERLIGTLRRSCFDWIIPLSEEHIRSVVREWSAHYNRGRPHMALGPGVPEPGEQYPAPLLPHRHAIPADARLISTPVLGGLHHGYRLERDAA
jgi:putative transposase